MSAVCCCWGRQVVADDNAAEMEAVRGDDVISAEGSSDMRQELVSLQLADRHPSEDQQQDDEELSNTNGDYQQTLAWCLALPTEPEHSPDCSNLVARKTQSHKPSEGETVYTKYTNLESDEILNLECDPKMLIMVGERNDFLAKQADDLALCLRYLINRRCSVYDDPIKYCDILDEKARIFWHYRAELSDGFVCPPKCVAMFHEVNDDGSGVAHGCLTYYTRNIKKNVSELVQEIFTFWDYKGAELSRIWRCQERDPDYWIRLKNAPGFEEETAFVNPKSASFSDFMDCAWRFNKQMLNTDRRMGLYVDMVRIREGRQEPINVICVVALFPTPRHPDFNHDEYLKQRSDCK